LHLQTICRSMRNMPSLLSASLRGMSMLRTITRLALLLLLTVARSAYAADEVPILIRNLPGYSLDQANAALISAITNHNYTFVRQQAADARLVPQVLEGRKVRIVYFCNFAKMERALNIDVRAAQMLPCRFTLVEAENGSVSLIAINPAWLSEGLNNPLLHPDCLELKRDYLSIMDEVSL